jgi:hypothetical protein
MEVWPTGHNYKQPPAKTPCFSEPPGIIMNRGMLVNAEKQTNHRK